MNAFLAALLIAALAAIQAMAGGTRLLFALPAYGAIAAAALLVFLRQPSATAGPGRLSLLSTVLLGAYVLLRAHYSPVAYLAWADYFEMLACLMVYGLIVYYLGNHRWLAWIFGAIMVLAFAQALVGLRQFSGGDDFMPFGLARSPTGRRASGFFINANHFACFMEAAVILAFSFACWSQRRGWLRLLVLYVGLAGLAGLAFSASRGGYLSIAAALLVFGAASLSVIAALDRQRAMAIGLVGTIGLGLMALGLTQFMGQSRLLEFRLNELGRQFQGVALDWRTSNWEAAVAQCQVNPGTGTGAGTHLYLGRYFRQPRIQTDPIHAHCDYLELVAEYGWAGGALMVFFVAAHVRAGWRRLTYVVRTEVLATTFLRHDEIAITIGALSAVAALAVHSCVDFNLHIPANALLYAIVFGVLGRRERVAVAAVEGSVGFSPVRLVLPGLGFLFCAQGLPKLPGEYASERLRHALAVGRLEEVLTLGVNAKLNPENPDAYFYLAEANRLIAMRLPRQTMRIPYLNAALANYRRSLTVFPQNEVPWVRLAQTEDFMGSFRQGEEDYLTALALDPNSGVLHGFYAEHLRLLGHLEEAEKEVKRCRELLDSNLLFVDIQRLLTTPYPGDAKTLPAKP